jgi:hypothetical protein
METVIFIQDGIDSILENYRFEKNTAFIRNEIKRLADSFLTTILNQNAISAFVNIMDETNNTNDVIENDMAILDTFIEITKGMEKLVHRTTINRTGSIASGLLG